MNCGFVCEINENYWNYPYYPRFNYRVIFFFPIMMEILSASIAGLFLGMLLLALRGGTFFRIPILDMDFSHFANQTR